MSRLVQLPNGTILDLDRVMFSVKDTKMIGKTPLLIAGAGDMAPVLDGEDVDALVAAGYIQQLKAPPLIKT